MHILCFHIPIIECLGKQTYVCKLYFISVSLYFCHQSRKNHLLVSAIILSWMLLAKLQVLSQLLLLQLALTSYHIWCNMSIHVLIWAKVVYCSTIQLLRFHEWGSTFGDQGEGNETLQDRKNPIQKGTATRFLPTPPL